MSEGVSLVIATGVQGDSKPERGLNRALEANTLDLLEMAGGIRDFERRILITNSSSLIGTCVSEEPDVLIEKSSSNFHFGRSLFEIISKYDIKDLFYIGGGSGPLFRRQDLENIVAFLLRSSGVMLANNFYSADMIGLSPAQKILQLNPPEKDNSLGWLARDAGLEPHEMSRNAKTQLDLDTPVDLLSLRLSSRATGRLREYLDNLDWVHDGLMDILSQFTDHDGRLIIAGRVGGNTWEYLEKNSACQLDLISEGRGSYDGTGKNGSRSFWLGRAFEELGPDKFLEFLGDKGTGVVLDTRILFDYKGEWPSRKDRFSSDIFDSGAIGVDYLRELTQTARKSSIPIIFGGHSMVSGSLYLLSEAAWKITEPESINIRPERFRLEDTY